LVYQNHVASTTNSGSFFLLYISSLLLSGKMSSSVNAEKIVDRTEQEIETAANGEDVHNTLGSKIKTTGFMILFSGFIGMAG